MVNLEGYGSVGKETTRLRIGAYVDHEPSFPYQLPEAVTTSARGKGVSTAIQIISVQDTNHWVFLQSINQRIA